MSSFSPLVLNIPLHEYIDLIKDYVTPLNHYKERLQELGCALTHPTVNVEPNIDEEDFPSESKLFGNTATFYSVLIVINYHVVSLQKLDFNLINTITTSVQVTAEEFQILQLFKEHFID